MFGGLRLAAAIFFHISAQSAVSYQLVYGTSQTITEFTICRQVGNNAIAAKDVFIPTNTLPEWSAFIAAPPPGVSVVGCAFAATGGSVTTITGFKIHTFTASGTFTVSNDSGIVEVLVVGGGGGGGGRHGGGGGGGGIVHAPAYTIGVGSYMVTIGSGGSFTQTAPTNQSIGTNGANSVFDAITALGGGGGGSYTNSVPTGGGSGGGGGAVAGGSGTPGDGSALNRNPGLANQGASGGGFGYGFSGGSGGMGTGGGGGGGAGGIGVIGVVDTGGNGGVGRQFNTNGTLTYYSGGGGGGSNTATGSTGGLGGAGNGGINGLGGTAGTANTGGGGGASRSNTTTVTGSNGGSGIVIVRYAQ